MHVPVSVLSFSHSIYNFQQNSGVHAAKPNSCMNISCELRDPVYCCNARWNDIDIVFLFTIFSISGFVQVIQQEELCDCKIIPLCESREALAGIALIIGFNRIVFITMDYRAC